MTTSYQIPEPSPRQGHISAAVDGKVCVWGGYMLGVSGSFSKVKESVASSIHSFDPLSESWENASCSGPSPPGLYDCACASVDQNLYVYGGKVGLNYGSSLHQLDTRSWNWKLLSSIGPMRKGGCGMVAYSDQLVLFGGYGIPSGPTQPGSEFVKSKYSDSGGWTNELHVFDLKEGMWSSPAVSGTRPPPCSNFSLTMIGDHHAVMFGGYQHGPLKKSNDVYMLDLTKMHWTKLSHEVGDLRPVERDCHAAVCLGFNSDHPQLFVTGGLGRNDQTLNDGWILDLKSAKWRELTGVQPRYLHTATAVSVIPGLAEVTIFGGAINLLSQIASTAVLQFELLASPGDPLMKEWVLRDTADATQLGTPQRVRMKEELMEEKFIQEIQRTMAENGVIDRKLANFMFVGPTGSGKSSLMIRLLKRARKELSLSTGVCDPVVTVDVSFHSATAVNSDTWEEVDHDLSLLRQMNKKCCANQPHQTHLKPPQGISNTPTASYSPPSHPTASSIPKSPKKNQTHAIKLHTIAAKPLTHELSKGHIRERILPAVRKHGSPKSFLAYLRKGVSLYLRDTGGQVEFQEMIALLVFGPCIFLFVFRVDRDFQGKFFVEYRVSKDESTNCYTSSVTTEEALLQFLSSVYAMGTLGNTSVKTYKPLVFIIGTHKDKLGPSAEEKIAKLNNHLDSLITKNGFLDLVQYADASKGQVMFSVDNNSEGDEDFKAIRSRAHSLISGREEFTIEYPITYLLFCLELQNLKHGVLSFNECKDMAANYGIVGEQVSHLLQFLHLRIGVIQYYDVDGLRHIVVKEPQVLFNKVTNLIIRTFSSGALTTKEQHDFQKGILTESMLKNVIHSDDQLSCQDFVKLLVHLRIITPYPPAVPGDQEERYFIPCVLNHVQESSEEELHTDILPLSVRFQCSHCPKGLFSVLVTHLMTPQSDGESNGHVSFTLNEGKIFKDQVSFDVCCYADEDELCLKMLPSHLEVRFFPSQCEDRDLSIGEMCSNIRQVIEASILRSLEDLHYNKHKVRPMMCFKCEHCSELHQVKKGKDHCKVYCEKTHRNSRIPLLGRCWYNEDEWSVAGGRTMQNQMSEAPIQPPTAPSQESSNSNVSALAEHHTRTLVDRLPCKIESGPSLNNEILLDVIDKINADWYKLGLRLGQSMAQLENFRMQSMLDNHRCCLLVFDHWISNGGYPPRYPLSWDGVYNVLVTIGHQGTAQDMKTALDI